MNKIKGAVKSKTIWFNAAIVPGVIVPIMNMIEANAPMIKDFLGDAWYFVFFLVVSMANIILRYFTKQSLEDKGNDKLLRS